MIKRSARGSEVSGFYYLIYCLFIILPIYQDSPFVVIAGSAGTSMMPVISMVGIVGVIVLRGRISVNKCLKTWIYLGIYILVISYIAVLVWWLLGRQLVIYQENVFVKPLKNVLVYFSYLAYSSIILMFIRRLSFRYVFAPIFFVLLLLTGICLVELTQMPNAFAWIHYGGQLPYGRVRLLTRESSWTAMMIYCYSLLSIFYGLEAQRKGVTIVSTICAVILLIATGSKTLLAIVLISAAFLLISNAKRIRFRTIIGAVLIVIFIVFYFRTGGVRLIRSLLNDIENYTSVATRSFTIFSGALIGLMFPTGVGAGIFIGVFSDVMQRFIHLLPNVLSDRELVRHIYAADDSGFSVCSGFFQYHAFWGLLGSIVFVSTLNKIRRDISASVFKYKTILTMMYFGMFVMICFAQSLSFEFWMALTILMSVCPRSQEFSQGI